jgi:hypothetical protein
MKCMQGKRSRQSTAVQPWDAHRLMLTQQPIVGSSLLSMLSASTCLAYQGLMELQLDVCVRTHVSTCQAAMHAVPSHMHAVPDTRDCRTLECQSQAFQQMWAPTTGVNSAQHDRLNCQHNKGSLKATHVLQIQTTE